MPNAVVYVDSVDLFKSRLDNFWMFQDVKYDYTAELTGTRDRFEYDIENYWTVVVLVFQQWYGHRGSSFLGWTPKNWLFPLTWKVTITTARALLSTAVIT